MNYEVSSPAKINIGLRVLSKRRDGFHNIETIFYPIGIYDYIKVTIEKLPDSAKANLISIKTNTKLNIENKKNICYRAVKVFLENYNITGYYKFSIRIKKNIPAGAGLGGGSSNAARVLKVLAKYFRFAGSIHKSSMKKIAMESGSDVPFFLTAKPAYAKGRGEKLTSLPGFKIKKKILVVNPGIRISTANAYKQLGLGNPRAGIMNKVRTFDAKDERLMINDFERTVFREHPKIEKIKYDLFRLGACYALMSGSGSTVYGFFSDRKILQAKKHFKESGYKVFEA
jgi:4-diphosphocytidyl-2-C-methyl-D-erythritol kinase